MSDVKPVTCHGPADRADAPLAQRELHALRDAVLDSVWDAVLNAVPDAVLNAVPHVMCPTVAAIACSDRLQLLACAKPHML